MYGEPKQTRKFIEKHRTKMLDETIIEHIIPILHDDYVTEKPIIIESMMYCPECRLVTTVETTFRVTQQKRIN